MGGGRGPPPLPAPTLTALEPAGDLIRQGFVSGRRKPVLTAQGGELGEQLTLAVVESAGRLHHDLHVQVAAARTAQPAHAQAREDHLIAALSARLDRHDPLSVKGGQREAGAQGGRRHGHAQLGVQVVTGA